MPASRCWQSWQQWVAEVPVTSIPKLPSPMGKWLGELHCSSPGSPPPPSLEVVPHSSEKVSDIPVLLLLILMAFQLWQPVTQPAFPAPAPTLQHITEVLHTTGLTQQGAKVCREVIVIISSSARAPDALRNKNGCWSNRRGEQETSQAALYSPCRRYNRDKEDRAAALGLGDK